VLAVASCAVVLLLDAYGMAVLGDPVMYAPVLMCVYDRETTGRWLFPGLALDPIRCAISLLAF
jgi:hypothetical protein